MAKITLSQAAAWCGGQVNEQYADLIFEGACGDHRWVRPGELFVALDQSEGLSERIQVAMDRGAVAVLTGRHTDLYPCIVALDPRIAVGDIARQVRKRIGMKVVGVTGSLGKTTVTEMIACVLDGTYRVSTTYSNQFEDIGVPIAILSMAEDTQVAVLEMGMIQFRDIAYLTSIACPDVAVITNVDDTTKEAERWNRETLLRAKLEILEGMREDGVVILNGDDDLLWKQRNMSHLAHSYYATHNPDAELRASDVQKEDNLHLFRASQGNLSFLVELNMEEEFGVSDSLAAIAVGLHMGVSADAIQERLSHFRNKEAAPTERVVEGYTIIDDCRSAGPLSMKKALQALGNRSGRKIAVLGDMLELGVCTQAEHYRVGRFAAENAEVVLAYGPNAERTISGAITGGMDPRKATAYKDAGTLVLRLKNIVKEGDVVLFKGGRSVHMERVLESFLK
jgi:UDP-N-acetylmuramoyl-tripeptide--D-alanyl-D-alanine ligase